ncbi:FG-GAP-like repeat-containing protein [Streptomyces zhihengii]|uniref:FG-GAP-like repeat-containing protein n=1 Tax=Streptomyces zhihengii TaxID=1818004 RepID=UPI003686D60A
MRQRRASRLAPMLALTVLLSVLVPSGAAVAAPVGTVTAAVTPSPAPTPARSVPAAPSRAGTAPASSAAAAQSDDTADDEPAPAPARASEECEPLALAPYGDPGTAVGQATIPVSGYVCFTVTAEQPGMHRVLLTNPGLNVHAEVFDGTERVNCHDPAWGAGWCALSRSGDFELRVVNSGGEPVTPSVTITSLRTTEGCAPAAPTSFDQPPLTGTASSPLALLCRQVTGRPGERFLLNATTVRYGEVSAWLTDETGARICPRSNDDDSPGCVLPGDGPYRVLTHVGSAEGGFPAEYRMTIRRLSAPEGCAAAPLNTYGDAPSAAAQTTGCRVFTAPSAGRYDVYRVTGGERTRLAVHDGQGRVVCAAWDLVCTLPAAGAYTLVTDGATLILNRDSAEGCRPAGLGAHQGSFAAEGEIDCLALPLDEGARVAVLTPLSGPWLNIDVTVHDAAGDYVCDWTTLSVGTCELTGNAPFRALVSADISSPRTGAYALVLHRTDRAGSCTAFPSGSFGPDGAASRLATGDGVFSHCLGIPADDHSASEIVQLQTLSGTSTARFSVLDANGRQVCSYYAARSAWTDCDLTPGVAHTVLLTGRDEPAVYTLSRRDVTAGARGCTDTPATAVGGPSTGGRPGAPGALVCHRVTTADAGDTLHLNVRDPLGTTNILAFDEEGDVGCSHRNRDCAVSGSTAYQVLLTVPASLKSADSYRLDALRIATSKGPAPECTRVPNVSFGYGPFGATLDEQHTATCAALPTGEYDAFDFVVTDTTGATTTAVPALYGHTLLNGCTLVVPDGYECSVRALSETDAAPSILVVGLPEKAPRTEYRAELVCTSGLCGTEAVTVGTVSPTSGATDTMVTVQVTGTALHERTKVRISNAGRTIESTTTAVSADRRTLSAVLDLTGAAPGAWNLSVITHNSWNHGRGTFTVTPGPVLNTALPAVKGAAHVGSLLTAGTGTWTPAADAYAYRWKADGRPVEGATGATWRVPASLLGADISVEVTASKAGRPDGTAESAAQTVTAARRDHTGTGGRPDGPGDLLTLTSGGVLAFRHGALPGTFTGTTGASGWSAKVTAVPFGDMNGDGCNDVLVRMTDGTLRAYRPGCGQAVAPSSPHSVLGGGWGAYDVLTSPGDITGDGRADLIARTPAGDLYRYEDDGNGKLTPRVRLGGGWQIFNTVVGAGDITGDGRGDLLARDTAGALWRYDGTGSGNFAARVKLGTGWQIFNTLVGAGDITGDGRGDLVARDTAGVLWRYAGTGSGNFAGRVQIGGGWQTYASLF